MSAASLLALSLLGCGNSPLPESAVLVTLGGVRPDEIGVYGGGGTPSLDALAQRGLVLERAYTTSPELTPALASTLSGLSTSGHGLLSAADGTLSGDVVTLAEALKGAGFQTAAMTSVFGARAEWGLDQGFEDFEGDAPPTGKTIDAAVDDAVFWLGSLADGPFFLWVHLEPTVTDGPTAKLIDTQIGRLQRAVEIAERPTHWVVVGARGEAPSADSVDVLTEAQVRVPLIVSPATEIEPRRASLPAASVVDVAPTILGLLKQPPLSGAEGVDLSPLFEPSGSVAQGPVHFATSSLSRRFGWPLDQGVTTGKYKWLDGTRVALLDADDPSGGDLSHQIPREVERLKIASPSTAASPAPPSLELLDVSFRGSMGVVGDAAPLSVESAESILKRSEEAWEMLGSDPNGAEQLWARLAEEVPGAAEPLFGRALALRLMGRPDEAAAIYASLEGPMAMLQRARALREAGESAEALEVAEALLASLPDDPAASAERLYAIAALQGLEQALAEADVIQGEVWSDAAAGVLLQSVGDPRAVARLEAGVRDGLPRRGVHAALGQQARMAGDISKAAAHFNKELRLYPERWEIRLALAELWRASQVWDKALIEYEQLFAARPSTELQLSYIDVLFKNERYEEADALLEPLLKKYPTNSDVLLLKANLLDEMGDQIGSRRYFELARARLGERGF